MPDYNQTCTYHLLRYVPNLIRDEWINVGLVMLDSAAARPRVRVLADDDELARVRRVHPEADLGVLRALGPALEAQIAANGDDPQTRLAKLDQTLSNLVQFSPRHAVLTDDADAEFDRLYRDHVEPPRGRARAEAASRTAIRTRITDVFRRAGVLDRLERHLRVDEFTYKGDPMRLDYAYRRNGTRGFVHALPLDRDPAQAKALAFTAGQIRRRIERSEFAAVTETAPRAGDARHEFVSGLLAGQGIQVVPLPALTDFVNRLRPELRP